MKHSLKATSIIEAIIVLLIVVSGITGVYGLLNSSQKLAISTGNRIEAIQIARDGLEGFTNIRDTNAILFSADYENCWNVLNYEDACIGDGTHKIPAGSYRIHKNISNQFELTSSSETGGYSDSDYRDDFIVKKDAMGFYTQVSGDDFIPLYTREMKISYLDADRLEISALIQWFDSATKTPQKVEMSTVLTNWRGKK